MGSFRVVRSKQLSDKLKKLRTASQGPVRIALGKGGDEMVRMARSLAPDGPGAGDLDYKSTIKWRFGAEEGGGSDGSGRSASTSVIVTAGDKKNPEGPWLEFGTAPHENAGQFKGTINPGITPQPHFFPSYRATKAKWKRLVSRAIKDSIGSVVK